MEKDHLNVDIYKAAHIGNITRMKPYVRQKVLFTATNVHYKTNLVNDSGIQTKKTIERLESKAMLIKKAKHVHRSIQREKEYIFSKIQT